MNLKEIIERLKDILKDDYTRKILEQDIAKELDLSREYLSLSKTRNTIPYEKIVTFCAKKGISINWILLGDLPKYIEEEVENRVRVKYFSQINASAGGGALNYESAHNYLYFDANVLNSMYKTNLVDNENILAFNVLGDSMTPTLNDGEIIIFDTLKQDINKGGIFVVSTRGGLLVKRIHKKSSGKVELISDNKSYPIETLAYDELENINFIGKVIGKVGEVF